MIRAIFITLFLIGNADGAFAQATRQDLFDPIPDTTIKDTLIKGKVQVMISREVDRRYFTPYNYFVGLNYIVHPNSDTGKAAIKKKQKITYRIGK